MPESVQGSAACGEHHIFPRDTFARTARAEVWCTRPAGHDGPHESTKGSMAFTWRDDVQES